MNHYYVRERFLAPLPRNLNLHKFLTANIPRGGMYSRNDNNALGMIITK